jgi:hypothetical protein
VVLEGKARQGRSRHVERTKPNENTIDGFRSIMEGFRGEAVLIVRVKSTRTWGWVS